MSLKGFSQEREARKSEGEAKNKKARAERKETAVGPEPLRGMLGSSTATRRQSPRVV